jgi:hypothetical protein
MLPFGAAFFLSGGDRRVFLLPGKAAFLPDRQINIVDINQRR